MMKPILIESDCASVLRTARHWPPFQLVYADPPFFTQQTHRVGKQVAFDDKWKSLDHFVTHVVSRLFRAWDLLGDEGSLVVHLDPKTSHYVKVALDACIGSEHFASEIIWRYRRWPTKTNNFQRVHDVLLRYVRDPKKARWTQLYEPLAPSTQKTWGSRKQRAVVEGGRRTRSSKSAEPTPGVPLGDVWDFSIAPPSERTGYPTQKPEALLERLIMASTEKGDRVLDPFCGSGTTLAVASRLGRESIGIDSSAMAIRYAKRRLGL